MTMATVGLGVLALAACGSGSAEQVSSNAPSIQAEFIDQGNDGANVTLADGSQTFLLNGTRLSIACVRNNDPFGLHGKIETGLAAGNVAVSLSKSDLKAVTSPYQYDKSKAFDTYPNC